MKRITGHGACSGPTIYYRLLIIENILGEDYDLDELKMLIEEKNNRNKMPKVGMTVYYSDKDTGQIDQGIISTVYYKNDKLDIFTIDFDCGDFDEFLGEAWNDCVFNSMESALDSLRKGDN